MTAGTRAYPITTAGSVSRKTSVNALKMSTSEATSWQLDGNSMMRVTMEWSIMVDSSLTTTSESIFSVSEPSMQIRPRPSCITGHEEAIRLPSSGTHCLEVLVVFSIFRKQTPNPLLKATAGPAGLQLRLPKCQQCANSLKLAARPSSVTDAESHGTDSSIALKPLLESLKSNHVLLVCIGDGNTGSDAGSIKLRLWSAGSWKL